MIRIVGIEQPKRGTSNLVLRFDDGSYLKATPSILTEFGLFTGKQLDESELDELKETVKRKMTKAKAAAMVGARPLSEYELKRRLLEKGSSEKDADEATQWLRNLGAVNDIEYASMIARRYAAKGYGEVKIKDELFKRGIPREMWDEALKEYSINEDSIDRFLNSKLNGSTDKKEIKKAADALFRRGFNWEEIQEALSRYENERLSEE